MHFAEGVGALKKQLVSLSLQFAVPDTRSSCIKVYFLAGIDLKEDPMVCITTDVQVSACDQSMPRPATMHLPNTLDSYQAVAQTPIPVHPADGTSKFFPQLNSCNTRLTKATVLEGVRTCRDSVRLLHVVIPSCEK